MKRLILFKNSIFIMLLLFLFSCTPDEMMVHVYTSDLDAAKNGEIVKIPLKITFSMPGKDEKNDLEKVEIIAKKYLEPKSKFTIVKGKYSNSVVIETTIDFAKNNVPKNSLIQLVYYSPRKNNPKEPPHIELTKHDTLIKELNSQLRDINFMLTLSLPPKNTKLRIISDSKIPYKIRGQATWVAKKPHLNYVATLNKREEIEMLFKGASSSIYSQLPIFFNYRKID